MVQISNKVYYIGVNDRKKHLFENNWPLPNGVSYNSYIITDEKTAVIDTLEFGSDPNYLNNIDSHLNGRGLDYLIVNHMEPDHSGMIGELIRAYPSLKVVANAKTFEILESYYPIKEENMHLVGDGDTLNLGYHNLFFALTPWVHWPETMMTYDTTDKILFSCDAFGGFGTLDGGIFDDELNFDFYEVEMRRYYSNIVGKWSNMVQKALKKLDGVEVKIICPSHGIVWRDNPSKVIGLYDSWSKYESEEGVVIAFASMYGNTEDVADMIGRELSKSGIKNIRIFDVSKTHPSYIVNEIWKYKGLILGSCAYNGGMHPMMHLLTHEISVASPKDRVLGLFGGSSWNGTGLKSLKDFASKTSMDVVDGSISFLGNAKKEKLENIETFVNEFISKLK